VQDILINWEQIQKGEDTVRFPFEGVTSLSVFLHFSLESFNSYVILESKAESADNLNQLSKVFQILRQVDEQLLITNPSTYLQQKGLPAGTLTHSNSHLVRTFKSYAWYSFLMPKLS